MENPENPTFWVYLGIFTEDQNMKLKAYYKALELDPLVSIYTI